MTTQQDNTQVNPETLVHEVPTHLESEEKLFMGLSMQSSVLLFSIGGAGYMLFTILTIEPVYVKAIFAGIPTVVGVVLSILKINDRPIVMLLFEGLMLRFRSGVTCGNLSELLKEDMDPDARGAEEGTEEAAVSVRPKVPIMTRVRRGIDLAVPMVYILFYRFVGGVIKFARGRRQAGGR